VTHLLIQMETDLQISRNMISEVIQISLTKMQIIMGYRTALNMKEV